MNIQRRHLTYLLIAIIDMALILGSYFLASFVYLGDPLAPEQLVNIRVLSWRDSGILFLVIYALLLVVGYSATHVFGSIYFGQIRKMAKRVVVVNLIGLVLFMSSFYVFNLDDASRILVLLFFVFSTLFVCFANWVAIHLFRLQRNSQNYRRNVLVVGRGHLAEEYAKAVAERSSRPEHVIGYIDPNLNPYHPFDVNASKREFLGCCLGSIWNIEFAFQSYQIDEIVLALDVEDYACASQAMAAADRHGVSLTLVPFYNDIIPRKPNIESFGGINLVDLRSMPLSNPVYGLVKRACDIVVSLFVIIVTSWLMVITAIGVKLSSPGPVLFKQIRLGKGNKTFEMLKFRSMRVNDASDVAWSTSEDPRKTRFGSFIRKYSIDELPQFFNVLKGDMSIVGPRPEIPYYVQQFSASIPLYMLRHQVRPGITGLAQISGLRGNTSISGRIQLDIYYIQHWSFWLDVKIFFKTLFGGFVNDETLVDSSIDKKLMRGKFGAFWELMNESASKGSLSVTFNAIYIAFVSIYVLLTFLGESHLNSLSGLLFGATNLLFIKYLPYALILLGLIIWVCEERKLSFWILAIATFFAFVFMSQNSGVGALMAVYAFIFAYPKNLDLKKVAIAVFASCALSIVALSVSSIAGFVPDVHRRGAGIVRHSLGFESPDMFAMTVTTCLIPYIYFRLRNWRWFDTVLCLLVCGIVYFIAQSRLAVLLLLFLIVFINIYRIGKVRHVAGGMAPWVFVGCFLISALAAFLYCQNPNLPFSSSVNEFLSGRLGDFTYVVSEFPISLFGNNLYEPCFGNGAPGLLNAIDHINCSYLGMLIRFGIIGVAVLVLPTVWLGKKAESEKNYSAIFVILVIALFGIIEDDYCCSARNFCIFIFGLFVSRSVSGKHGSFEHRDESDFVTVRNDWIGTRNSRWSDF